MFTGIVEELGKVKSISHTGDSYRLVISCDKVMEGTRKGDSIAVNGVCLTVTDMTAGSFSADVMPETIHRSSLGELGMGSAVNLERAMPADGRFGGHIVSGHIDGTGSVADITNDGNAIWYTISTQTDILRYIVEKGSVALDGISLTVAYVDETGFKVSAIPHTRKVTNLGMKKCGDTINIENDIVGKYVEKLLVADNTGCNDRKSAITEAFLIENGFIGG